MVQENIDSFLYKIFHINPAIEFIIISLQFDVPSISFSFDYLFKPEFFLVCLVQSFFIKCSNNFFTVDITIDVCSWYIILYFFDHKDFLRPIWCVAFCKNIFVFRCSLMKTKFGFRIFVIIIVFVIMLVILVL